MPKLRASGAKPPASLEIDLSSPPDTLRGFLLAADVRHFVEHIADAARVNDVSRCNLMLKLPGPMTQPNINSFFERELGFTGIVVLNDAFSQGRLLMWLWGRRESASR